MSQQYSLRWNNHQPNFISMFTTLLNTQTLVDVTLAAEGKHLQAHKVVLSACSTYFQALFVENPSHHPIVILKDVTFADLRTMVDFMYYGEVNVTEEQLPQVLETAKLLKIKGLTEMPESTLTRAQGGGSGVGSGGGGGSAPGSDFAPPSEPNDSQRMSTPATSPCNKRRRRRKSSTGSTSLNLVQEEVRDDNQTVELVRDGITLSSVPQRRRDFHDERHPDATQQTSDNSHMNMDPLGVENPASIAQELVNAGAEELVEVGAMGFVGGGAKPRRLKRQNRVPEECVRRQVSEPTTATPSPPALRKHDSYPQYATKNQPPKSQERSMGSVLIRAVSAGERSTGTAPLLESETAPRVSHTPAVRSGPPLSCNYCWNTVDECGRILRRKTQYHCPECRTNLCIVPCFHEYHEPAANAR